MSPGIHPLHQEDRNTKRKLVCERKIIAWTVAMTCLSLKELNTKHTYMDFYLFP